MAILDLKSNLSGWRKPSTVQEQEKKKISSASAKAVYSTSNELKAPTDIKINKVDNSTSIQVPGAKKIEYKFYSINSKRGRSLPAISTLFGDTILEKISNYKEQRPTEINKTSEFVKITPTRIQHISSVEILKTILKEKLSLFIKNFPTVLSKVSLYKDQLPINILKLSLYKDQIPNIIDKLSLYKDQIPSLLDKLSLYKDQVPSILDKLSLYKQFKVDNFNSIYDTREEIIRLLRFPLTLQIYANKTLPVINAFNDLRSGSKGFTLNQTSTQFLGLDTDALTYTYPKTVKFGRLNDRLSFTGRGLKGFDDLTSGAIGFTAYQAVTQYLGVNTIAGTYTYPSTVKLGNILNRSTFYSNSKQGYLVDGTNRKFDGDLSATKFKRTYYTDKEPYTTSTGITGDDLRTYFTRTNSKSARDWMYTKFNLRDNSFNTGLALADQPLILSGIQRKDFINTGFRFWETWKFDDGFIRGGVVTSTQRAIVDVLRIGKWFASTKGLLFTARQAGLQGSAPNTEADPTLAGRIKNGAYSLASSLVNTATQHLGLRFRKDAIPYIPRTTYSSALTSPLYKNRLIMLKDAYLGTKFDPRLNNLLNGLGGPQSVYGIGRTNISRAVNSSVINYSNEPGKEYYTLGYNDIQNRILELQYSPNIITNFLLNNNNSTPKEPNAKWIATQGKFNNEATISDYQYTSQHQRPKLQVPDYGKRGKDLRNPLTGSFMSKYTPGGNGMTDPIWQVNQPNDTAVDDFVKFMFHDLNTNERFRFRAYIENISEDFNPNWQEVKILGRADSPYIYQGFERTVSVSFKAAALSRGDLMLMWDQLERLAKTTVPKYLEGFKMKGPLIKFTLGNWFINTPAFIRSLSYTVDNETPWEINLGNSSLYGENASISSVGELPMYVTVQVNLQIFGETRPETTTTVSTPAGVTDIKHYSAGNLYPLGGKTDEAGAVITDFRTDRQRIFQ